MWLTMLPFPYDFWQFYVGSRIALAGGNPYDPAAVSQGMLQLGWPPSEGYFGFLYPFWSLWLFIPFGALPFPAARIAWELVVLAAAGWPVSQLLRPLLRSALSLSLPAGFAVFAAVVFPPLFSTVWNGQTNAFLLLGIVAWLRLLCCRKVFWSGVALSLTAVKPQLFVVFYLWLSVRELRRGSISGLLGLGAGIALQCCLSASLAPQAPALWLDAVGSQLASSGGLPTPALPRIIAATTGMQAAAYVPTCVALLAILCSVFYAPLRSIRAGLGVFLPVSMLCAPYLWSHAYLPLLPAYFALLSDIAGQRRRLAAYGLALVGALGPVGVVRPQDVDAYMIVIPLALLGGTSLLLSGIGNREEQRDAEPS